MRERVSMWRTETFARLNEPLALVLGDKTAVELGRFGLATVGDLLAYLPVRYLAGTETTDLSVVMPGEDVALVARVQHLSVAMGRNGSRLVATLADDGGHTLEATWFGRYIEHWQRSLSMGIKGIFVGKVGQFNGRLQMTNPDYVMLDERGVIVGQPKKEKRVMAAQVSRHGLVGIYRSKAKFPTWRIAECAQLALHSLSGVPDPLPAWVLDRVGLPGLLDAYSVLHQPVDLTMVDEARDRLKFDEALALQATMMVRRKQALTRVAEPIVPTEGGLLTAFDARLPFTLTQGQRAMAAEIEADLARPTPMQRLLQGEVGSGKTVVALRAMLTCVDAGRQAALMAPTEVLAAQHYDTFRSMLGDLADGNTLGAPEMATEVVLLTGSMPAAAKREAQARIASGEAGIVIGTHALLSDAVSFADLGLVVIDEQHRFGVEQRAALQGETVHPHVLVMTATPIPRSVAMTIFGDLEMSTLTEIPAGRADVQTNVVATRLHPHWLDRVWERVSEEVAAGRQAFIVCPRISVSDADQAPDDDPGWKSSATVDEVSAMLAAGPLSHLRLGVMHGQLSAAEKTDVMARFVAGEIDALVSTTVIEVGVDVPNASAMVVLDADRFGISQLHQLRGRIGRGAHPGICLLVTNAQPDSPAAERLRAVASTRDGFELATVDLAQRREGNVLGAAQSGATSNLRLLRVLDDAEIIEQAREIAIEWGERPDAADDPVLADMVRQTELAAQPDWMERN